MQGSQLITNVDLVVVTTHVKEIIASFSKLNFTHIYYELNEEVDGLSKEGLTMSPCELHFVETSKDVLMET
jgi:hypothetical protein